MLTDGLVVMTSVLVGEAPGQPISCHYRRPQVRIKADQKLLAEAFLRVQHPARRTYPPASPGRFVCRVVRNLRNRRSLMRVDLAGHASRAFSQRTCAQTAGAVRRDCMIGGPLHARLLAILLALREFFDRVEVYDPTTLRAPRDVVTLETDDLSRGYGILSR